MTRRASRHAVAALSGETAELPDSIVLIVAHPDDEAIGVGGRLAWWADRTTIVHVTDGAPLDGVDAHRSGYATVEEYAEARRREAWAALAWLPRAPVALVRLGFPDQGVTTALDTVVTSLRRLLRAWAPRVVVTHAYEGGHPDHDAIAFALQALRTHSCPTPFEVVEFAEYHEDSRGALVTNRFSDSTRTDGRRRVRLTPQEGRLKRLMLGAFTTQRSTLDRFACDEEWLRPAKEYDFSQPPASRVWFDRFNWGVTSERWRAIVADVSARLTTHGVTC